MLSSMIEKSSVVEELEIDIFLRNLLFSHGGCKFNSDKKLEQIKESKVQTSIIK